MNRSLKIGLTGGIASGKSTVANLFANEYQSHCACVMRHQRALRTCVVSLSKNGIHFVYQALPHSGLDTWVGHSYLSVCEHTAYRGLLGTG